MSSVGAKKPAGKKGPVMVCIGGGTVDGESKIAAAKNERHSRIKRVELLLHDRDVEIIQAPIIGTEIDLVRHDPDKLADEILRIFYSKAPTRQYGE